MATEILDAALGEIRVASTTSGGTALSTTIALIQLPLYSQWMSITPRNFAGGANVARFSVNPWLYVLKTTDNLASQPMDYSEFAQDADTATSVDLSSLSTLANGDFVLIGSHLPFRGVSIDVDSANDQANNVLVEYWNNNSWTNITATDNTDTGNALAVDGTVTWTVPTAWVSASLESICNRVGPSLVSVPFPGKSEELYWTRWSWSAALGTAVTLDSVVSLNRSTNYAELLSAQAFMERIKHGSSGVGCIEALTDAGTANLVVNVAMLSSGGSFK